MMAADPDLHALFCEEEPPPSADRRHWAYALALGRAKDAIKDFLEKSVIRNTDELHTPSVRDVHVPPRGAYPAADDCGFPDDASASTVQTPSPVRRSPDSRLRVGLNKRPRFPALSLALNGAGFS